MTTELPKDYEPFRTLIVCSNVLVGGQYILTVGTFPVLLIGKGVFPLVWCSIPVNEDRSKWVYVIERNSPTRDALRIEFADENREIIICLSDTQEILRVRKIDEKQAEVDALDLRPLGFDVYGDKHQLRVGRAVFKYSTFSRSIIRLSPEQIRGMRGDA